MTASIALKSVLLTPIDKIGLVWVRNRSQTGYKIPLVTLGRTVWFSPDFIDWSGGKVICVDTKGDHLEEADARGKLLVIQPHMRVSMTFAVAFVTWVAWNTDGTPYSIDGYSDWELGAARALRALPHEELKSVTDYFLSEPESDDKQLA